MYDMLLFGDCIFSSWHRRFKGPPTPKAAKPPELPPPVATPREISAQAAKVGGAAPQVVGVSPATAERRGIKPRKGKFGRRSTRITRPTGLAMIPAPVARAGLKTSLG